MGPSPFQLSCLINYERTRPIPAGDDASGPSAGALNGGPPRAASGRRRGGGESPAGLGPQADARAFDPRGSACAFSEARKASALKPPLGRTPALWLTEVKYSFPFLLSKHDFRDVARCSGNPPLEDGRLSGDW